MRNADLRSVVDRFAEARIAVVGDLVADEYLYGETDRISREAPVLIVRYEDSEFRLGCGANAAANVAALGARVLPIGLVGDDGIGERLRGMLRGVGADPEGVLTASGRPTASSNSTSFGLAMATPRYWAMPCLASTQTGFPCAAMRRIVSTTGSQRVPRP